MENYPPYMITDKMLNYVSDIMKKIGEFNYFEGLNRYPELRRKTRIKSIHSSLAIENNQLSLFQVEDVINGKMVIGEKKDIQEVKNAMERLNKYGLTDTIREVADMGKPFLGICLGLQLLFDSSEESPGVEGLGILPGKIIRFPEDKGFKIPQIGWNSLDIKLGARLFKGVPDQSYVYFVHSYYLKADDENIVAATSEYAAHVHASIEKDNIFACQFHPEKSGEIGLKILENFANL